MTLQHNNSSFINELDTYYYYYDKRARELKERGNKIIGYLCALTPKEIISAAGLIPFRIKGDISKPITKADSQMETLVCSLVRNSYDLSLKKQYDFLDGIVIPHACDSISRTYPVWQETLGLPYSHFINMPHGTDESSVEFFRAVLLTFINSISKFASTVITESSLNESIQIYNKYRKKIRELYNYRKTIPSLISGTEVIKALVAGLGLPINEAIDLISIMINEANNRKCHIHKETEYKKKRLMIVGAEIDSSEIIELIESYDADVVTDDLCPGLREYSSIIKLDGDPIRNIAEHYLLNIKCARTFRKPQKNYRDYLEDRFGHIKQRIKEFSVDGVILYIYKFCDPFGFEIPALKNYIESQNIPVLHLEDEYSNASLGRIRTRIQAFIELINQ